ncbi:MAG: hydantoinase B/oxoprolinase family protein [Rhodospirillaceae bacterium]|nr:hydantoinase B/oxoprolinase family protein [Rhodospirillaceae bacterium]
MSPQTSRYDSILLEVVWTRMISIVDEAAKAIVRTSFSTLSNEANDFACVLTDKRGFSLAQNSGSIPSFIATLPATVRDFIDEIGYDNFEPGDVLITNDPWKGTGHLSDVCLVCPIFRDGKIVAFAATTSHVPDIGGRLRAMDSRQVFEEGVQIPLMKIISAGKTDETLVKLLSQNVRTPEQTLGDIWAQISACELMRDRMLRLMDDYALADLTELADELFDRAEAAMRKVIAEVPDGVYRYAIDTDGGDERYHFAVAVTVNGSDILVDYDGTSPSQPRAINCVMAYTYAMSAYAIKCALLPDLANNEGMFRPITVTAPEDSLINPRYPAAVVARASTGHYLPVCVFGALQQVIPEKVMAAAGSPLWVLTQTGINDDGKPYTNVLFYNGGMGATANKDGEGCLSWPSNISSSPIEISERNSPLFCRFKRFASGSGGAGKQRGGLGQEIEFVSESERPILALFMTERTQIAAPGFDGGGDGQLGAVQINGADVDTNAQHVMNKGDTVLLRTPGGGGYGDPRDRPAELSDRDRKRGYV